VYPALVPGEATALGYLITDLTAEEWHVLDTFEDEVYELRNLALTNGGHGWAYVCPSQTTVGNDDWHSEQFASQHLPSYTQDCARWRHRYDYGK
jgi:gamma-glutamylcyclotransferase (GGCT)/AIG2-like uncharacterized protein YtfP